MASKELERLRNSKNVIVIKTKQGKRALDFIKRLFYGTDTAKAKKWASKWSSYAKSKSVLIIYTRQKTKHEYMGFKFAIGNEDTGSVLGEEFPYDKGMRILSRNGLKD